MGSSFGQIFRVTTFGESHGKGLGCIIEGCPPNIQLNLQQIQQELDRRRPGQSKISTPRKEKDQAIFLSGIFEGKTLGTPISILFENKDADSSSYQPFADKYRPSHADFTYDQKYGHRDWRGGGRASARETATRVAAGAVAKQILEQLTSIQCIGWVSQLGNLSAQVDSSLVSRDQVEANIVRCPDQDIAKKMQELIEQVRREKDTVGGIIRCICHQVPSGLGEPVFDKLEADLAKAMLSIPASKGFEIGSGFSGVSMRGSAHNDIFIKKDEQVRTKTNFSGGIQGGISNGMPIEFSVAFKPVATIFQEQDTIDKNGDTTTIKAKGRHDPCVLPRAVPIVEAMAYIVLLDHFLRQQKNLLS